MKEKLRKHKIFVLIIIISTGLLIYSGISIYFWHQDNLELNAEIKEIEDDLILEEIEDKETTKEVNPPKKTNAKDDYWEYIKLPLINVNFNDLLKKNKDTVAFLKVNGTNINYPVVQASDNDYYLTHTFNKKKNPGGWVFLDYRNNLNNLDANTIIYAHGRENKTMFGSLKNILTNGWYKNTNNYVVHLSTPNASTLWQVFSVYKIPTETYYLTSNFGSTSSHEKFLETITNRSAFNFNTSVNTNDKILTLSTCYNDEIKVVLHAKLIKMHTN